MKIQFRCSYVGTYLNDKNEVTGDATFTREEPVEDSDRASINLPNPHGYFKVGERYELTLTKVE